jgi:hypothetical protein
MQKEIKKMLRQIKVENMTERRIKIMIKTNTKEIKNHQLKTC